MLHPRQRRDEWLLFCLAFIAFAWFHQGGGWNQNGRFALVRAIVERGTFYIDSHLVYRAPLPGTGRFRRVTARDAEIELDATKVALGWRDQQGRLVPISGMARPGADTLDVSQVAATGDVAYYGGHFHPNKAPGTSFSAVPAYFFLYHAERLLGLDPDEWRTLTVNAWLTSALSVGLLSAFGVILLYRLALRMSGADRVPSLLAAITLAFGTMYFPYATMLYEHNVAGVALLASWYLAQPPDTEVAPRVSSLLLSGFFAGWAAITTYLLAVAVVIIGVYVLATRRRQASIWFSLGVLVPFLVICAYNAVCFGTPFTTNYRYEHPMFISGDGALLGVFQAPSVTVLAAILVSPFRGLFVTAPVLIMGAVGLAWLYRARRFRSDALLVAGIIALLVLFNISFEAWHAGWAPGPRYLVPMLPFLVLPTVYAYQRARRATVVLLSLSAAAQFIVTAVDAQPPVGAGGLATVPGRALWTYSPLTEYALPLMVSGQATPILRQLAEAVVAGYDARLARAGAPREVRAAEAARITDELDRRIEAGDPQPLALASIQGPVSANPMGVYESTFYTAFGHAADQSRWNSFNVGEVLAPRSVLSLLPLLFVAGALLTVLLRGTPLPSS